MNRGFILTSSFLVEIFFTMHQLKFVRVNVVQVFNNLCHFAEGKEVTEAGKKGGGGLP